MPANLPEAVRKVISDAVDWNRFHDSLAVLAERAPAGQEPDLPLDYPDRVKRAFDGAARHLRDGEKKIRNKEYLWLTVSVLPALIAVVAPLFVARLGNAWYGVVVAALGQGGFFAIFFTQVLNYLRGEDALARFITHAQIAFDLCLSVEDHRAALKWFLDVAGRLQGIQPPQPLPPAGH